MTENMTHTELVRALSKDGQTIINELTPEKAHLWHMASALLGEIGELFQCPEDDKENGREEIGDCLFYLEGIHQYASPECEIAPFVWTPRRAVGTLKDSLEILTRHCAVLFDHIKRYAIYNNAEYSVRGNRDVARILSFIYDNLRDVAFHFQSDLGTCRDENITKLLKRYEGGKYSNQAAKERADKS